MVLSCTDSITKSTVRSLGCTTHWCARNSPPLPVCFFVCLCLSVFLSLSPTTSLADRLAATHLNATTTTSTSSSTTTNTCCCCCCCCSCCFSSCSSCSSSSCSSSFSSCSFCHLSPLSHSSLWLPPDSSCRAWRVLGTARGEERALTAERFVLRLHVLPLNTAVAPRNRATSSGGLSSNADFPCNMFYSVAIGEKRTSP